MIRFLGMVLLLSSGAAIAATPVPEPVGQWTIQNTDNLCMLSHTYGAGNGQVILTFRPVPLSRDSQIILLTHDAATPSAENGDASVQLGEDKPIPGSFESYRLAGGPLRYTQITLAQPFMADLATARTIAIDAEGGPRVVVASAEVGPRLSELRDCQDNMIRHWGIDPSEMARIAVPAQAKNPSSWITSSDYPSDALHRKQTGTTVMLWTIGTDGRVSDCRVITSSKVPALDKASCDAITRRGRYTPARDASGKPIATHATRNVVWSLPYSSAAAPR